MQPPACLGRGVIVAPGSAAPGAGTVVRIDDTVLREPAEAVAVLHEAWSERRAVVVEVGPEAAELRAPESETRPPHALNAGFEFTRERLYFLVRANNYDDRHGRMIWGPAVEAVRAGASPATPGTAGDVVLPGNTAAWCDGGPRAATVDGLTLVHRNTIEHGALTRDRDEPVLGDLAADQREAVAHDRGAARVIAPAGSGKTRVLTERFRLLTVQRGWDPRGITAVAYNVRAKDTMKERLADLPEPATNRIRTLHSLGNHILRRGTGAATLLDEWEMRRRIEALAPVRPRANTDVYAPYLEALTAVRLGLVDPARVEQTRDDVDGFAAIFSQYREKLRADGAIDHDEQIYGAIEVLLRDPSTRHAVQKECRHLLVDEFQDLTPAQLLMLRLVAAPAYDVFGVGDDDQVIYGYAGADPEFLVNYDRYFPGGTHHALRTNYRCPPAVVAATRNLLSYNRTRIAKDIVAAKTDAADALTVVRTPPEQLAGDAVTRVREWLAAGAAPTDVAVLTRVNASLLPVQLLLHDAGIACWTPVSTSVLNRTGTRTALAYLRCAAALAHDTPMSGADIAHAVRRPSRGIRREIVQRLERKRSWRLPQLRQAPYGLNETTAAKFEAFCDDLAQLGRAAADGATTAELLTKIRDDVGLGAALATLDQSGKGPDASHRDDLNALIAVGGLQHDPVTFERWLHERLRAPNQTPSSDGVAISTVHRVKGMEWPYVVVLGAHDGLMPHSLAADIEEERRIFHVAVTRAATAVHIIAADDAAAPFVDQLHVAAPPGYHDQRRAPAARTEPKRRAVPAPPTGDLGKLVDALKGWRKQRAAADKVPAYVVLNDTHLAGIATDAPTTLDALARCAGIGPTKLERYGDEIIAVVAEITAT